MKKSMHGGGYIFDEKDKDEILYMIHDLQNNIEAIHSSGTPPAAETKYKDLLELKEFKDEVLSDTKLYAKGWKWIYGFMNVVWESLQIAHMKDFEFFASVKNVEMFKHVIGWGCPLQSIALLGVIFAELTDAITTRKAGKMTQPTSINEKILSGDLHSFQVNVNYDFGKGAKILKLARNNKIDLNVDDLFNDWNFEIDYQIYQEDNFIKTNTLENMKERLFMERSHENLAWNSKTQEKINFLVNIVIDLIGMLSRVLAELIPPKFETFEERFLSSMEPSQKQTYKDLIAIFIESQKEVYPELRKGLANFYNTINEKLRSIKQFLDAEIILWKDNQNIANTFVRAKKKLKNALKNDLENSTLDLMTKTLVRNNIKAMEKLAKDINVKNSIILGFKSAFSNV